jgi:hypothetical protein
MDELSRHLKIFFLEDNPDDVELELHELQRSGIDVEYQVARNHSEFVEQIGQSTSVKTFKLMFLLF